MSVCLSACLSVTTRTDRDDVLDVDSGGPKEGRITWVAHWRHLVNTIEPSTCSYDAALC